MSLTRGAPAAAPPAAASPDPAAAAERLAAASPAAAERLVPGAGPRAAAAQGDAGDIPAPAAMPGKAGAVPAAAAMPGPCLPLFRRGGWYDSRDREAVLAAPGSALLSQAPPVLLRDDAAWFRRTSPPRPSPAAPVAPAAPAGSSSAAHPWRPERAERERMVARAMERFATGAVEAGSAGVQTAAEFERALDWHCGLPPALTRRWNGLLASQAARLAAAAAAARDELPAGTLALVSLPANTFVCLEAVLDLVLRGAAVWVRPSRREPFAALRLAACLLAAGWPRHLLGFYPTARQTLGTLVRLVDLAVLFGGPELEAEFGSVSGPAGAALASGATTGHPRVEIHGPGRARAVVTRSCAAAAAVGPLLALVAADAGRFCTNAGTILCTHSAAEIGRELAERLDALPLEPPGPRQPFERLETIAPSVPSPRAGGVAGEVAVAAAAADGRWPWPLAACPEESVARATAAWIAERLRPGDRFLTRRPLLQRSGGRARLAPALVALDSPAGHPLLGVELPFPFAVIAEVPGAGGDPSASGNPGTCGDSAASGASGGSGVPGGAGGSGAPGAFGGPGVSGDPGVSGAPGGVAVDRAGLREDLMRGARFVHTLGAGGASSLEVRIPDDAAGGQEPGSPCAAAAGSAAASARITVGAPGAVSRAADAARSLPDPSTRGARL
jgi:hypothetical protein